MASGIINWIIEKYLSNILEINKDLTKSSIFTGEIQMANLKIKTEIFTLLDLPFFELVHGYVGKLRIKVKMPRVHLHPIRVEVENVFFHAKQKKLSNINKESEIKFMEGYKISQLQGLEEFKNEVNNYQDEVNPNMLSKLINNIEININNICIRFDDEISYSLTPFCFGILLKNIKFKTVDKDFKEVEGKYSLPFEEINNKIVKMESFSIFLDTFENEGKLVTYDKRIVDTPNTEISDEKFKNFLGPMLDYYRYCLSETYEHIYNYSAHNYILFNLGFLLKLSINENLKNGKPKITVDCQMDEIKMELSLVQIKAIIKLSIYQILMLKYQTGLSKEYYNRKLTEEEKMEYIDNYIIYHNHMYGKKPNEKKAKQMKNILNKVEERLKYEEIQIMRNAAESKMKHSNQLDEIDKQINEIKKNDDNNNLFKRLSFKKKKKEVDEEKQKEKMKQIEELQEKKSKLEKKVTNLIKNKLEHIELLSGFFPDASGDFSLLKINFEIPVISFNINRTQEEKLFSFVFKKFVVFGDLKNRQQLLILTINDMSMLQYQLPESKYETIMTTVQQKNDTFKEDEKKKINACYIELENNPEFINSNFRIKFRNQKRIIVIANIFSLQYISKRVSDYLSFFNDTNFDFPERYNASGEIYQFIKDGFKIDNIETYFQHFNADLDVTIKSPIILFPIDILDNSNRKCILVRCGDFHILSILPPRQDPKINYAEVKERLKLMDTYMLNSDKLCVTTLDNFDGDLSGLLDAKGLNIIEDVSFGLTADIMFESKNKFFEKFKVDIKVGNCKINIRDIQLPFFMEMIEKSGKLIKLAMYELENKTSFEKKEIKFNKEEEEMYIKSTKNVLQIKDENIEKIHEIVDEINTNTKNNNLLEEEKNEKEENNNEIKQEKEENNEIKLEKEEKENNNEIKEENIEIKEEKDKNEINTSQPNEINTSNIIENNNNQIIKKEEEQISDPKLLIFNFHIEKFQFCIQKTISYGERQILLKIKDENLNNLIYRDFILFDVNNIKIELLLTEKLNVNANLLIRSIGIIDKETLITNENNPEGDLYMNKEFQHLIKMDSGENKKEIDKTSSSQMFSRYSSDSSEDFHYENYSNDGKNKNMNKKDDHNKYFMILNFKHDNDTQTQYADILLKKIKICISMSTISRVSQFAFYYLDMFNKINEKSLLDLEKMEREHQRIKMKNRLIRRLTKTNSNNSFNSNQSNKDNKDDDSYEDDDELELNEEIESDDNIKLFGSNFVSKLAEDINKNKNKENDDDLLIIDTSSSKLNNENNIISTNSFDYKTDNDVDKEAEETLKNKEIKLSKIFRTKNKKINIKIKCELRESSILFPLDDTKSVTKVLRIKSNIAGNVYLKTNVDLIRDGNSKLVKVNFKENNFKAGIKILNVEFGILDYRNGIFNIQNKCDRILNGFRLCLNINHFLLLPIKEQAVTLVNLDLEPIVFNIGFSQIKNFIRFLPVLNEFFEDIKKEYDDPIKEIEDYQDFDGDINYNIDNDKDNINLNKIEITDDLNIISTSTKNNDIINKEKENEKSIQKYKMKRRNKRKKAGKKQIEKKIDDKPEVNILIMNNTFDVNINIEKTLIKIIDDSEDYLQPLLNIELKEPPIKFILNTNSDSVENISNLLYESISRKELSLKDYDIKNLTLYGEISFSFSVIFYNNRINDWEPIIEKYEASITIDQITWFSRLRILFNSNDMLNLNLSYSILSTVNNILKKFLYGGEKTLKLDNDDTDRYDRIAVEFINLSGIGIACWLDAEDIINNDNLKNYKFNLDSDVNSKNHKKKIKRDRLNNIYQKLTEAQLKIKKDKFSFKVQGYLPITSNDFSSNYTTCFNLQKEYKKKIVYKKLDNNLDNNIIDDNNDIAYEIDTKGEENNSLLLKEQLIYENEEDNIIDTSSNKKKTILINEANEEENIEIYIKIRKNGSLKLIIFESNIFFYNNLQIPISLSLISQRDFNLQYNSNDNIIDHEKNNDKIVINSGTKKSLSLIYLIKKYRIYISFYDNSNKDNCHYSLLYENFDMLKNNYHSFVKYQQENMPTYKGRKEVFLNDYYSRLIEINHKNNNYYICSNLILQHGANDIIKDIPAQSNDLQVREIHPINLEMNIQYQENKITEDNDNKSTLSLLYDISHSKALSYLFVLNESLVIENQLPFNIECQMEGNISKQLSIRPLRNKYYLDIDKNNTKLRLVLKYQNHKFKSDFFDIKFMGIENQNRNAKKGEDIETIVQLYEENQEMLNRNKYIECNIKIEENIENDKLIGAYEKEYEHNVKSFSKKRKIIIYNKCIIINKTDYLLYIKSEDIKERNFDLENYQGKLFPNSVNILNTKDVKNTFKLKNENSNWSDKFNINTIGHIGVISLELREQNNKIVNLEIGISISSSWNFPNSLLITIEPRFLLINKFGYDLQYKQYNNKKDKMTNDNEFFFPNKTIKNNDEIKLNLLKDSKNMKKMIQIKMGIYSMDYSCPVDLDQIGDVDVKIPINEDMKKIILKKNIEIEKKIYQLKKKEKLKKKLDLTEEKTTEEETNKINEEKKNEIINNNDNNDENDNIINTKNSKDNLLFSNTKENENNIDNDKNNYDDNKINTNLVDIDNLMDSNININKIINNNENNQNINNNNNNINLRNADKSFSESSSSIFDDDELSIENFPFAKKIENFLSKRTHKKELSPIEEKLKKIEERNKKLEQVKMRPRKYFIYNQNNESFLLVRITKAIYKGLIYIVIFPPENPQYIIKNQTDFSISIRQKKDSFNQENIILEKNEMIPYAWADTLKDEKLLYVQIDNNDVEINLNEIKVINKRLEINDIRKNKKITTTFFFQTIIENNRTRTLIIKNAHKNKKNQDSFLKRIKEHNKNAFNIKIKLYTKGLGISIINREPKELFYISFYGLLLENQIFSFNKDQCFNIIVNMKISLKNFQMDYCLDDLFKSMIIPKNQITPQKEELNINNNIMNNNSVVPLFQGIISFHRVTNQLISVSSDEFPQLDFTVQPIKVNVSNYQIMSLIDLGLELKSEFDFYLSEPEKIKKFDNIEDLEKFLLEQNTNINEIPEYDPEHYDPLLNSKLTILPEEIIFNSEKHYMFFIKNIAIGSLVIILTTRIDLNSFRLIPTIFSGLSSFIGNIFTHITDYNLYLPSLYYTDVFTDISTLSTQLTNSYISQLKKRIFKIIGSLDILGNPTGYASSLGQGFLEIFEAPRRGLIHGPLGFGEGVAKGFGTFITTVISSSFDLVGKISGTLLASCEELQGIKNTEYLEEREPSNIFSGLYYGVKNGIIDIGKGVAGIFIRPYQEMKRSGFGGFIQGVGVGLIGAAVSPLTAGLRIANNLIVGIKNTALIFNPKLKTERFRYPRTIQKAIRLSSYDEDEATVRAILDYIGGYNDQEIIYFKQFKYINPGLQGSISTLILTDKCIMIVYQAKELVFKIDLDLIRRVEVHKEPNNLNIDLIFYLENNTRKYIRTNDLSLCIDFYLMFENVKE